MSVRTRIAPSPTGDPHVGTAYVALFNYALPKKHGGQFLLRIEDTDRLRSHPASERMIYDALHWLGLTWEEMGSLKKIVLWANAELERLVLYHLHKETLLSQADQKMSSSNGKSK